MSETLQGTNPEDMSPVSRDVATRVGAVAIDVQYVESASQDIEVRSETE